MAVRKIINRRIVLHSRPVGAPTAENFRLEEGTIPAISSGQVLLRIRRIRMQGFIVFEDYGQRYGG